MNDDAHHLLLVEDDPADIFLAEDMFEAHGDFALSVVSDGSAALEFLRQEGEFADAPRPDLVLLDLNIPGLNGRDVLREVKCDDRLRSIPIIVMSTSDAPDDIRTSYALGASCFITKPVGIDGFEELVKALESFWFRFAQLPPRD